MGLRSPRDTLSSTKPFRRAVGWSWVWYRHYFYFCAKYNVPGPNALFLSFETKFARLEYVKDNQFNMAFVRYTGKEWVEVYPGLSLEECLEAVENDPYFEP